MAKVIQKAFVFLSTKYIDRVSYHLIYLPISIHLTGEKLNSMNQAYPVMKLMHHIAEEHIGTEKYGKSPVTLRLLVSRKEYEGLKDATFKNPFLLSSYEHRQLMGEQLWKSITVWLNAKEALVMEKRVPSSEKLYALNLSIYCASSVAESIQRRDPVAIKYVFYNLSFNLSTSSEKPINWPLYLTCFPYLIIIIITHSKDNQQQIRNTGTSVLKWYSFWLEIRHLEFPSFAPSTTG